MPLELRLFVKDFAEGLILADAKRPQALSSRSRKAFAPGIGPHSEKATIELVMAELEEAYPDRYSSYVMNVPYEESRQRCDLVLEDETGWSWAIELKLFRLLGDNGKVNDNMLMHILFPYPAHRSALTDCRKLSESSIAPRRGILIFGYEVEDWPLAPAIEAFELLAASYLQLGSRAQASFETLVHPVHARGTVFGWAIA